VTLIVSRQQVLPQKDPEVAAALEDDFLRRGVVLCKGARAEGIDREEGGVTVRCNDGRVVPGSHALLAIGSVPNSEDLGLASAGVRVDDRGYVPVNKHLQSNVGHVYAAGDLSGKLPLASVAMSQGRKIRVTKVPFAANARALIDGDARGFVKILSDPATGVVLGGSIVGESAAELISVIALAVSSHLRVSDVSEALLVHPALAEALGDAAE
jgi:dihydrolipoamide dehydrogenase